MKFLINRSCYRYKSRVVVSQHWCLLLVLFFWFFIGLFSFFIWFWGLFVCCCFLSEYFVVGLYVVLYFLFYVVVFVLLLLTLVYNILGTEYITCIPYRCWESFFVCFKVKSTLFWSYDDFSTSPMKDGLFERLVVQLRCPLGPEKIHRDTLVE
jgi:hypothetical protein